MLDLPDDMVNDVAVMVSELVTNAFVHTGTSFAVTIDRRDDLVYVEVTDAGSGLPTRRSPGETESHGRGLAIVEELSDQWGTIHTAGEVGKAVWFTLNLPLGSGTSDAAMTERGPVPEATPVAPAGAATGAGPAASAAAATAADDRGRLDALEGPSAPESMPPIPRPDRPIAHPPSSTSGSGRSR